MTGPNAGRAIDTFDQTDQVEQVAVTALGPFPQYAANVVAAPEAIGGTRGFYVEVTGGGGRAYLYANDLQLPVLRFEGDSSVVPNRVVSWDGAPVGATAQTSGSNDPTGTRPTGLNHQDLTEAYQNVGFRLLAGSDRLDPAARLATISVYTDATRVSSYVVTLPYVSDGSPSSAPITVPFASFNPVGSGGGADFHDVGAIYLSLSPAAATNAQVKLLGTSRPTNTANLVNLPEVDLVISKTDGVSSYVPGTTTTYSIVVSNNGPRDVTGATVADVIPATLTGVAWTSSTTGNASVTSGGSGSGNTVAATVNLPAGAGNAVVFTVTGMAQAAATGSLVNTATVSPPRSQSGTDLVLDTDLTNNTATDIDTARLVADLAITKTDGSDTYTPGQGLTYTIVVSNLGPTNVQGATVTDAFDAALGTPNWAASGTAGTAFTASGSGNLLQTVSIPAAGSITYTVTVAKVDPAKTGDLVNTATVQPPQGTTDPTPGNNTATDRDTPRLVSDLAITKTDGSDTYTPGQGLTYTIVVSNIGPTNVQGATVADTFDAALGTPNWTASGTTGTAFTGSGSGNLLQTVSIPAAGSITYAVTVPKVDPAKTGNLVNTATVQPPTGTTDPTPGNNTATDTDAPRLVSDLTITKTDGSATYTPGQGLTYTIVVGNAGPSNVSGASVADTFDAALGTPTWTASGTTGAAFTAGGSGNLAQTVSIPTGGSITYTVAVAQVNPAKTGDLVNTATVQPPEGSSDPTPSNNTAADTDTPRLVSDLAITKTDGSATYTPGQGLTYTIVVSNAGPSQVQGATVADTFDAALGTPTWTASGTTGAVFTANGSGNLAQTVSLPVGGSITYTVAVAQVNAARTGDLINVATVAAPSGVTDPTPGNNTATDTDSARVVCDLAVTKTDGSATYTPGQGLTYTIVVSNVGPANVQGATVADTFDAALGTPTWTATGTAGAVFTASGSGNLAQTVSIPVGGSITYTATVAQVNPSRTGDLVNTATVAAPSGVTDPTPSNNTATDTDTARLVCDLVITKTDGSTTYTPGQGLTYTIVASNVGPSNVQGATVADTFDSALGTPTWSATGTTGTVFTAAGSGNLAQTVSIPTGGSITYTATAAQVSLSKTGDLVNTATVTAPTGVQDPTPANNTATDTDTLAAKVDLAITKDSSPTPVAAGQQLTYTLHVTNNGPSNATGTKVTDTLPTNVTYVSATASRGTVTQSNGTVTVDVGILAVQETITVTIVTTVAASALGTINNQADVVANEGEANTTNNRALNTTAVTAALSSIAGAVYLDNNRNGVRDTGDGILAGITVTLTGTDGQGNAVTKTATTDATGAFLFSQLKAGTYTVAEAGPTTYQDGKDTVGTLAANTATNDAFANIALGGGVAATDYLFGEMPLYFSKRAFLGSSYQ